MSRRTCCACCEARARRPAVGGPVEGRHRRACGHGTGGAAHTEVLTRSVNGVSPERVRARRAAPSTTSEIVELTMTTSFFNYLHAIRRSRCACRWKPWALDTAATCAGGPPTTRDAARRADQPTKRSPRPPLPLPRRRTRPRSSQQSRARHGQLAARDAACAGAGRRLARVSARPSATDEQVGRDIKLQVSFAVSMANECRYCTLHQVLGLRRLGVDPAKLHGDEEGRLRADAAREGRRALRAQAHEDARGDDRRRLRGARDRVRIGGAPSK